jgi:ribosomal protein S27E
MSEVKIPMNLPLDTDGFLRRECPYCKREFKIFPSEKEEEGEDKNVIVELFCPYCGQSAGKNSWWTQEQLRCAKEIALKKVLEPELEEFGKSLESMGKGSFVKIKMERLSFKTPKIHEEADDMKLLDLHCCNERIKFEENWKGDVHCIICGKSIKQPD